jgi:hypothetical protein
MEDVIFDVSAIPDAPLFENLDENIYPVQIVAVNSGVSSGGHPQVEIQATVTEGGPVQKSGSLSVGRGIKQFLTFKEGDNAKISKATLKDLFKKTNTEWPEDGRLPLVNLIGKQVQVILKPEIYNGQTRMKVSSYKALA